MHSDLGGTLNRMRRDAPSLIKKNFQEFSRLVDEAKDLAEKGEYRAAAAFAEIATAHANCNPCGLFASRELERILIGIGKKVAPSQGRSTGGKPASGAPCRILHVASSVASIGGLSRMMWRWIRQDCGRVHSVALIRQREKVPSELSDVVGASGGSISRVAESIGGPFCWARRLRRLAAAADLVVLHVGPGDVVPMIAFADRVGLPPIIYLDHADHMFWLGGGISDVVVSLRESGMRLARERRGIEESRSLLLPIILEPARRTLSRRQAKLQLGLPVDATLVLSVARAIKYRTVDGVSYADAHAAFLERHERAILAVVGPGAREDWADAMRRAQGRIIVYGEVRDPTPFFQAADIYVDSYPFVSRTSLLEAGTYGVPLVTRNFYSDDPGILGADMPGLADVLVQVKGLDEYTEALSRLAENEEARLRLGEEIRERITALHTGSGWQHLLENVYKVALSVGELPEPSPSVAAEQPFLGEPDVFLPYAHGCPVSRGSLIRAHLGSLPLKYRMKYLGSSVRSRRFPGSRFDMLKCWIPQWLLCRMLNRFREAS